MNNGSIAKDTLAVCLATILLVALLIGAAMLLRPESPATPSPIEQAAAPSHPPYIF